MTDREKVIRGLEICGDDNESCADCPYADGSVMFACITQLSKDALALLKEQEMRELSESCENCNEYDHEKHYCPKFCRVIRETVDEMRPKWIPVTDILPSAGEEYWTLRHFERLPIVQILKYGIPDGFDSEYFYAHDDEWGEDTAYGGVTHWLPKSALPELPKGENDA